MSERLLAIETATSACSVALSNGHEVFSRSQEGNNIHSQVLLTMIAEVLSEAKLKVAQLDAVAVGQGPGSFTGLRIGIGVAQGIAYGAGCNMIGVSSLAALAAQAYQHDNAIDAVLAGIDARMNEVYCAQYQFESGLPILIGEQQVLAPELIMSELTSFQLVGNAWQEYWPRLNSSIARREKPARAIQQPNATAILVIAKDKFARQEWVAPSEFQPEYIRNNVAKKKGEQ